MRRKFVRLRGASAAILDSGRRGPVLLALHGYPDTGRIFERLAAALPDVRVLAPDWPGQGKSEPCADASGPTARGRWLAELLDVLGVERCTTFGHDMGALPALALARDHGARVERVVVANALLSDEAPTSLAIRALRTGGAYRLALRAFAPIVFARCLATFLEAPLEPPLPEAVHALWAAREAHFPIAHAHALQRVLPRTRLEELPGAHWMAHERARELAARLVP